MSVPLQPMLDLLYEAMDGSDASLAYSERHGIKSQAILTVFDDETASSIAEHLADRIAGKVVVEVGGGIGLLAFHLGRYAKRVFCIEASPVWASAFLAALLESKPKNVSYLFGTADEFADLIKADVALFCAHSGIASMKAAGRLFAPEIIDVYGEIILSNPASFDELARKLREFA